MSVKKQDNAVQFRPDAGCTEKLNEFAAKLSLKLGRRVTLSETIRLCIGYGLPILEGELGEESMVDVAQISHTEAARNIAIKALDNALVSLQNVAA
jgi:hypothetical protein